MEFSSSGWKPWPSQKHSWDGPCSRSACIQCSSDFILPGSWLTLSGFSSIVFLRIVQCSPRTWIVHADSPVLLLFADKYYVTIASATPAPVPDKLKDIS